MMPNQYMYLDSLGIAALYADLHGEDVVETIYSVEDNRMEGTKLALTAFLAGSAVSNSSQKETRTQKATLTPQNMLRRIVANLRASGTLYTSISAAIKAIPTSKPQVFFETRHPFSVPLPLDVFNRTKYVMFLSGFPPYDEPSSHKPKITMAANLCNFPSIRDGHLSPSGHDGLLFTKLNGSAYEYTIFGRISSASDEYQIKPFAIRT